MNAKFIILSSGVGSRLAPLTDKFHKSLIPIGLDHKPNLIRSIELILSSGYEISDIYVVVSKLGEDQHRRVLSNHGYEPNIICTEYDPREYNNNYTLKSALSQVLTDPEVYPPSLQGMFILEGDIVLNPIPFKEIIEDDYSESMIFTSHRDHEWKCLTDSQQYITGVVKNASGHCMSGVSFLMTKDAISLLHELIDSIIWSHSCYWEDILLELISKGSIKVKEKYFSTSYSIEYDSIKDLIDHNVVSSEYIAKLLDDNLNPIKLGSMTNSNYLITMDGSQKVLRLPKPYDQLPRKHEFEMTEIATSLGIGPSTTLYDCGVKISDYLRDYKPLKYNNEHAVEIMVEDVCMLLHLLHNQSTPLPAGSKSASSEMIDSYMYEIFNTYKDNVEAGLDYELQIGNPLALPLADLTILERFCRGRLKLISTDEPLVLSHMDLYLSNILVAAKPRSSTASIVKLIDYEYSGYESKYWDYGSLISEYTLDRYLNGEYSSESKCSDYEDRVKLVELIIDRMHRGCPSSHYDKSTMLAYSYYVDLVWGLWGLARCEIDAGNLKYGLIRLNRARGIEKIPVKITKTIEENTDEK